MSDEGAPLPPADPVAENTYQAVQDLDDILAMQKGPAYQRYFLRRLAQKKEPIERALLNEDLSEKDAAKLRGKLAALREIETMLADDERGSRSIIGQRHLPTPQ